MPLQPALPPGDRVLPRGRACPGRRSPRAFHGLPSGARRGSLMPWAFVLRKLCRAFFTLGAIVTFVFVILRATGDPAVQILGADASQEALQAFREKWGLDDPIWQQFLRYAAGVTRGEFGISLVEGKDALDVVLDRLPKTIQLMSVSAIVTLLSGIPVGIYAALH